MMTNEFKTVLYTGVTSNLQKRVFEHKFHIHENKSKFTEKYKCEILVYYESTNLIDVALNREKEIKGWNRKKKDALVNSMNSNWKDLAHGWFCSS